jgi:hypothetical protein
LKPGLKEWHLNAIQAAEIKIEQLRSVPVLTSNIRNELQIFSVI